MAKRRMFNKEIVRSDAFLEMSLTAQALYFQLGMEADDDGFLNNANTICRLIGANKNDLDLLVAKKFLIALDNGIIVVKHRKMNNYIQRDRYTPTQYKDIKQLLYIKENGSYTLNKPTEKIEHIESENDDFKCDFE